MMVYAYRANAELPTFNCAWHDSSGKIIDFSTGHTFEVKLVSKKDGTVVLTKSSGILGFNTNPNVVITWSVGDLNKPTGLYYLRLKATNIMGDRYFSPNDEPIIRILPAD